MSCSGCGNKSTGNNSGTGRAMTKGHSIAPAHMHSQNKIFNFGPYGAKVSKTIVGRANPRSNKKR